MEAKKRMRIVVPLLLVLAGIGGALYWVETAKDSDILRVSGNIEVTDAELGFKIPGRLLERRVDEGENVRVGQILARLEDTDQALGVASAEAELEYARAVLAELEAGSREEDVRQAEAQVAQARSFLEELERGNRRQEIAAAGEEVKRAEAALVGARSRLELARSEYERYQALYEDKVASYREYERVQREYEAAKSAFEETEAALGSAREALDLREEGTRKERIFQARAALHQAEAAYARVKAGPRVEAVAQARAKVRLAEEALRRARQQLAYTELRAPFDGVVLSKAAEPGEYLMTGAAVVTVGRLDRVWLRAYVPETEMGRIELDGEAEVRTDTYPGKTYTGRIAFISSEAEFTPKSVQTYEERVKLMYRIKIDLVNPNRELKPGMPADAVLQGESSDHADP
jgi:HlyD family secretion protein